jgi:hypothetical protein
VPGSARTFHDPVVLGIRDVSQTPGIPGKLHPRRARAGWRWQVAGGRWLEFRASYTFFATGRSAGATRRLDGTCGQTLPIEVITIPFNTLTYSALRPIPE